MDNRQFIHVLGRIINQAQVMRGNFKTPEMCNLLTKDYSPSTVSNAISRAVKLGMLVKVGSARSTSYKMSDHLHNNLLAFPQDKDKKFANMEELLKEHIRIGKQKIEIESKRTILHKPEETKPSDNWKEQFIRDLFNYIDVSLKKKLDDLQVELDLCKEENEELHRKNNELTASII